MEAFVVEYLVIIKVKGGFCNSIKTFNKLLEANSNISINKNQLQYLDLIIKYEVQTNLVEAKDQRYFHLKLQCDKETELEGFNSLLKDIREVLIKADGQLNTIWDDVSEFYSIKSYPLIFRTENLMRKLITKFMFTKVGLEWVEQSFPEDIKSAIKKKSKENQRKVDILHSTDFIHLADFLFKPYQTHSYSSLWEFLNKKDELVKNDLDSLKKYQPKSNWERYFSQIVPCEDGYLSKRWEKLYELRCFVAHNNFIKRRDFEDIEILTKEINEQVQKAISEIDKIIIPSEDKEKLVENTIGNINELFGEFIIRWRDLEHELFKEYTELNQNDVQKLQQANISQLLRYFNDNKVYNSDVLTKIRAVYNFRNNLIHKKGTLDYSELDLKENIKLIIEVTKIIKFRF